MAKFKLKPFNFKQSETDIKKSIKKFLNLHGWFNFPVLQGMGAYKGITDIIACKNAITLFIEVKTENGRQSEYQKRFQQEVENAGCVYILARSAQDVEKAINSLQIVFPSKNNSPAMAISTISNMKIVRGDK